MKKLFRIGLLVVAFIGFQMSDAIAQKFGYVNSQLIISELPDVKQMNANLKALGEQLQKKGELMVTAYKQKEDNAVRKKEQGTLSPLEEENILAELKGEQEKILNFEKEMQQTIYNKEQELTKPILAKMNQAIEDVAKEQGYTMIFDVGVLLYAEETDDLSALVKAKLGI